MKSWHYVITFALTAALLAAACGGKPDPAETAAAPGETSAGNEVDTQPAPSARVDEFVVYIPEATLRREAKADAPIVATFKEGTRVKYLFPEITTTEGGWVYSLSQEREPYVSALPVVQPTVKDPGDAVWRKVEAGGRVGWLADKYVLRADIYDAFARTHELGRAGDAPGMVAAIRDGYKKGWYVREYFDDYVAVSPDGKKAAASVPVIRDQRDFTSGFNDTNFAKGYTPVLFFVAGRGLVEYVCTAVSLSHRPCDGGAWSSDSRYFAWPMDNAEKPRSPWSLDVLDTEKWERRTVGLLDGTGDETASLPSYGFDGGYLFWTTRKRIGGGKPPHLGEDAYQAIVMAYEMASGGTFRALEGDLATVSEEDVGVMVGEEDAKYYDVIMAPAAGCPEGVKKTDWYRRNEGSHELLEDLTGCRE
ncbi:MAG: hypothetical protein PVH29_00465 [Candidatus Zixiibacteriota bacterium]